MQVGAADPRIFGPERPIDPEHSDTAFVLGRPMRPGRLIARTRIREGIHPIAQRLGDPHRVGAPGVRAFHGTWGHKGLPIAFTDERGDA